MEKILVLGDIHGRTIWKDIIERENPDKTIFLGDYVTTHDPDVSSRQQINNLKEILLYKENNIDNVVLLRGNHCLQSLGYYWASCSNLDQRVLEFMSETSFKRKFLDLTQWIYIDGNLRTIFSHAGVSQVWMDNSGIKSVYDINKLEPFEIFGFTPGYYGDYTGDSCTQPPTWIRPTSLVECAVEWWNQVVGHTPVKAITKISLKHSMDLWLCDTLDVKQYLIIDNGEFQPKTFER